MPLQQPELCISLADLRYAGVEDRCFLEELESRLQDTINGLFCSTEHKNVNADFARQALIPILLSLAARHFTDSADDATSKSVRNVFSALASESLSWALDRDSGSPVSKH